MFGQFEEVSKASCDKCSAVFTTVAELKKHKLEVHTDVELLTVSNILFEVTLKLF